MIKIATFDIETTALSADFGIVLCAVVKSNGGKPIIFRGDEVSPRWFTKRSNDKRIVKQIRNELEKYDILVAHNGLKFDLPFLRTRLACWGLKGLTDIKLIDPVQIARNKLRMSYNSLAKIAEHLGVNSKTPVDGKMWVRAALDGDKKAMNYVVTHCIEDVNTLEAILDAVKPYCTAINTWGSGR